MRNNIIQLVISQQNNTILGAQNPASFTVSYYTSLADAENNENNLSNHEENNENNQEEYTPKLFSDENEPQIENDLEDVKETNTELLDQDINEEEDFEIPAFLRKQKF